MASPTKKRKVQNMSPTRPSSAVWLDEGTLSLDTVRAELIRQEETIIFALIERSQFAFNAPVYASGDASIAPSSEKGKKSSFLDFFLTRTEALHASLGRFTSPDENPFLVDRQSPSLVKGQCYPANLRPNNININAKVKSIFETQILPRICQNKDDDGQYGSSASCDIALLQALSKRIHFGKFVAEAKFRLNKQRYTDMIRNNDSEGLMRELTKPDVEKRVVERVVLKASTYGRDPTCDTAAAADEASRRAESADLQRHRNQRSLKILPDEVGAIYRDYVMPLNKEVQVMYLLQRLGGPLAVYVQDTSELLPSSSSTQASTPLNGGHAACSSRFGISTEPYWVTAVDEETALSMVKCNTVSYAMLCIEDEFGGIAHYTHRHLLGSGLVISGEVYLESGARYIEVSKQHGCASGNDKTTVSINLSDKLGSLSTILSIFARENVNLILISSSRLAPRGSGAGPHFFVDFEGHISDKNVKHALSLVREEALSVNFLGSYPKK